MNAAELLLGSEAMGRHGNRVALQSGGDSVTYRELAEQTARAASAYEALGLKPGEPVLILMRDTPQFAAAWLGALRMGATAIALNNKSSEAEYRHILQDSQARLALVEGIFARARPDLSAELAAGRRLVVAGEDGPPATPRWETLLAASTPRQAFEAPEDWPAFFLYSSGTTGPAKGMVHTHGAIRHVGAALRMLGVRPGDTSFCTSRFFFAYGLEHGLLAPLSLGATSAVYPDWPEAEAIIEIISTLRPRVLFSVPTVYRRLLAEPQQRLAPFRAVQYCVAAGERVPAPLVRQWRDATGVELLSLYGMSETFCACLVTPPGTADGVRTGKPVPGLEARLLGPDGAPVPPGSAGVLWVRHPAQVRAYHRLPERTREQFKDGWYCTRDLFRQDADGHYIHQGRADELVKIAGQWVLPSELEEAVAAAAEVAEAVCVPVADRDGFERLAVFVVPRGSDDEALRAAADACERTLPRHKRPKWLRAVHDVPRTATGKVQRFKLRESLERELKSAG